MNSIDPGTIACVAGTLSGDIYEAFVALLAPADVPLVEVAIKRLAFAVASGTVANIVDSITDTNYLQVSAGEIIGAAGGGGGGAPDDAEYLVRAAHAGLSAEHVVTDTSSVVWDYASTPGQAKASVPAASTSALGVVELATSAETTAGLVVQASDTRLSDARTPTAHASTHLAGGTDPIAAATTSARGTVELATSGETTAGLAVQASDTRLSDARDPTAHASTHLAGGTDPIAAATTSARGTVELATDGETASGVVVQGNDSRLADDRIPTSHAGTHASFGSDPIAAASTSSRGTVELATDGETTSGLAVQANDGRIRGATESYHSVRSSTARGSTNTMIYRWIAVVDDQGSPDISYSNSFTNGGYWTINADGIYSVSCSQLPGHTGLMAIKVGASLSNTYNQTTIKAATATINGSIATVSWVGKIDAGEIVWIASDSATNPINLDTNSKRCSVTRLR